jgi:hypothetical protein
MIKLVSKIAAIILFLLYIFIFPANKMDGVMSQKMLALPFFGLPCALFPEYLSRIRGFVRGMPLTETPAQLISLVGWFLLILPVVVHWLFF